MIAQVIKGIFSRCRSKEKAEKHTNTFPYDINVSIKAMLIVNPDTSFSFMPNVVVVVVVQV